jgi:hypothetical protein
MPYLKQNMFAGLLAFTRFRAGMRLFIRVAITLYHTFYINKGRRYKNTSDKASICTPPPHTQSDSPQPISLFVLAEDSSSLRK